MDIVQDKLSFIQKSLDMGEYDVVIKECSTLFELSLKRIFKEAIITLPFEERSELFECEKKIGKGKKGVHDFTFGELVGLFRESRLMSKWTKHSSKELGLISSLDFGPIVNLRNQITHDGFKCSRYEAELINNYLRNLLATFGLADLKSSISTSFRKDCPEPTKQVSTDKKVFKYYPDRGIIINPSDDSRNVSFKVETLNRIFDTIFREIALISNTQKAQEILWKSGYDSGRSFGSIMNSKWELEQNILSINDKISKWCDFDSDVGWGRFINNLDVNEDLGVINGAFIISENFQNYNRGKEDALICNFVRGYSEGVIEELLGGIEVVTVCEMEMCPKSSALKKRCHIKVKLRGE